MDYRHLDRHSQRAQGDTWIVRFVVRLPANEERPITADVRTAAETLLKNGGDRDDGRYISIGRADLSEVAYHFDGAAWIRDNFGSLNPQFAAPSGLVFPYQNQVPRFIYTSAPVHDLRNYILELFEHHLEQNKRSVISGSAMGNAIQAVANASVPKESIVQQLLRHAADRLFDLEFDYQRKRIVAKLSAMGVGVVTTALKQAGSESPSPTLGPADSSGTERPGTNRSRRPGTGDTPAYNESARRTPPTLELQQQFVEACRQGTLGEVKKLLAAGAAINEMAAPNELYASHTPLWYSVHRGRLAAANFLLDSGADPNAGSGIYEGKAGSVLHSAIEGYLYLLRKEVRAGRELKLIRSLIDKGADPSIREKNGLNARQWAIHRWRNDSDPRLSELLKLLGENSNAPHAQLISVLQAPLQNLVDVLSRIHSDGPPDPDLQDEFCEACAQKNVETMAKLVERGAKVNSVGHPTSQRGVDVPLMWSIGYVGGKDKESKAALYLLGQGADPNCVAAPSTNRLYRTILLTAIDMVLQGQRRPAIVRSLLEHGADPTEKTKEQSWFLRAGLDSKIIEKNDHVFVDKLNQHTVVKKLDALQFAILSRESYAGYGLDTAQEMDEVIRTLKAEPSHAKTDNPLPSDKLQQEFILACAEGRLSDVRRLLNTGVDINRVGDPYRLGFEHTPLYQAVYGQHRDVAAFVLDSGADINRGPFGNKSHATVLHLAVALVSGLVEPLKPSGDRLNPDFIQYLLSKGADPSIKSVAKKDDEVMQLGSAAIEPDDRVEVIPNSGKTPPLVRVSNKRFDVRQYAVWLSESSTNKADMDKVVRMLRREPLNTQSEAKTSNGKDSRGAYDRQRRAEDNWNRKKEDWNRKKEEWERAKEDWRQRTTDDWNEGVAGLKAQFANTGKQIKHAAGAFKQGASSADWPGSKSTCSRCGNTVQPVKKFNWGAFLLLFVLTSGFGGIGYIMYFGVKSRDRCPVCNAKIPS